MDSRCGVRPGKSAGLSMRCGLIVLLLAVAGTAMANTVNVSYLEGQNPVAPDAVTAYGPDLFGDRINLFNLGLEFEQTDLSLPGNSALSLTRKHNQGLGSAMNKSRSAATTEDVRLVARSSVLPTPPSSPDQSVGGLMAVNRSVPSSRHPVPSPAQQIRDR